MDTKKNKSKGAIQYGFQKNVSSSLEKFLKNIVLKKFKFVRTYKGWIPSRFFILKNNKFSFIHIDVDLYEPTYQILEFFFPKLIKADTLLSGERILSKKDLIEIIQSGISGYQLEVATNQYFLKNKSIKCFWSPSSAVNNYKYNKFKFFKGIVKDLKMYYSLVKYLGFLNFLKQIDSFCQEDV